MRYPALRHDAVRRQDDGDISPSDEIFDPGVPGSDWGWAGFELADVEALISPSKVQKRAMVAARREVWR